MNSSDKALSFEQARNLLPYEFRPNAELTAVPFYERNGFQCITESDKDDETRLMFFDLKNFITE